MGDCVAGRIEGCQSRGHGLSPISAGTQLYLALASIESDYQRTRPAKCLNVRTKPTRGGRCAWAVNDE